MNQTSLAQESATTDHAAPEFNLTPPPHAGVMAVTKRNGREEPVDLNKIVRAVSRCCEGLYAVDPMRVATQDHQRPVRRRHHARARRAVDPDRRAADRRRARVRAASAARLLGALHRQGSARPGDPRLLAVDRPRPRGRPDQRAPAGLRAGERAQAQRRDRRRRATSASSTSACAPCTTATCCKHPTTARTVIETPQQFFLRIACALCEDVPEALDAVPAAWRRWTTCRARRRCSTPARTHEQLSSCFLLDSPRRFAGSDLRRVHRRRDALEVLRRHRPGVPPRALARLADPRPPTATRTASCRG